MSEPNPQEPTTGRRRFGENLYDEFRRQHVSRNYNYFTRFFNVRQTVEFVHVVFTESSAAQAYVDPNYVAVAGNPQEAGNQRRMTIGIADHNHNDQDNMLGEHSEYFLTTIETKTNVEIVAPHIDDANHEFENVD